MTECKVSLSAWCQGRVMPPKITKIVPFWGMFRKNQKVGCRLHKPRLLHPTPPHRTPSTFSVSRVFTARGRRGDDGWGVGSDLAPGRAKVCFAVGGQGWERVNQDHTEQHKCGECYEVRFVSGSRCRNVYLTPSPHTHTSPAATVVCTCHPPNCRSSECLARVTACMNGN